MIDPLYKAVFEKCYKAERLMTAFMVMSEANRRRLYEKMGRGHLEFWQNEYYSLMRMIAKGQAQDSYEQWKGEIQNEKLQVHQ